MKSSLALRARTFVLAASLGLAACSSVGEDMQNTAPDDSVSETSTTVAEPVITVASTMQDAQGGAADVDPNSSDNEQAVVSTTTTPPATVAPSTTAAASVEASASDDGDAGGGEDIAVAAQLQDDDDDDLESLPKTGPNEAMLVIAIGCALIVGGRTLIDLVNSAAQAIHRLPARTRANPPR